MNKQKLRRVLIRAGLTLGLSIGLVLLGWGAMRALVFRVPPGRIGVRVDKWSGGVDPRDYGAGYHLGRVGLDDWRLLSGGTHVLAFASAGGEVPVLELRTQDGNGASVEVTLTYSIRSDEAHMLVEEAREDTYPQQVRGLAESLLRQRLGALTSEEWFDPERYRTALEDLRPELEEEMVALHVDLDELLLRGVFFSADYDRKLQSLQVLHQEGLLSEALTTLEEAQGRLGRAQEKANADVMEERELRSLEISREHNEGKLEVASINARSQRYTAETQAAADATAEGLLASGRLEVEKAQALGSQLRLASLAGDGGRVYLAREAARNLHIDNVTLNSNDPSVPSVLDLDELVALLVGSTD